MFVYASIDSGAGAPVPTIDWLRVEAHAPGGVAHLSCIKDAGRLVPWSTLDWLAGLPVGTGLPFQTRTSADYVTWSGWSAPLPAGGGPITSPPGRYLQYQAILDTVDALRSPRLDQVCIVY
jgi:hypothetical protein